MYVQTPDAVKPTPGPARWGDPPALSDDESDDVIAFLATLTDGWVPPDR